MECLTELAKHFELILFTASHPHYATHVVDILDPTHTLFSHRLYRSNCIQTDNGLYIKDLRVLNRDLQSTLIIDNSVVSFAFQLDNGIPIVPFYDDKEDRFLLQIKDYLLNLKDAEDFGAANKPTFSLKDLYELEITRFLKYYSQDEGSDDENSGDSVESSCEAEESETAATTNDEEKKEGRSRWQSLSLASLPFEAEGKANPPAKMRKKAQAEVEDEMGKLRISLPKYLATQERESSDNSGH